MRCVTEDFVASDNFHGTRIARGDYLIGTRIASGGVTRVVIGILIDPLMRLREQVRMPYIRLVVGFRMRPIACRVSRKQQLHDQSIWNDILPDLRS